MLVFIDRQECADLLKTAGKDPTREGRWNISSVVAVCIYETLSGYEVYSNGEI